VNAFTSANESTMKRVDESTAPYAVGQGAYLECHPVD
jgi:hypothetical protein